MVSILTRRRNYAIGQEKRPAQHSSRQRLSEFLQTDKKVVWEA